jgi:Protein of unknown function (DUF2917)
MNLQMSNPRLLLHPGQSVVLDDAKGVTICPHEAKVWVTLEGDSSDFVVQPGEDFVLNLNGRTLVQAINDSTWIDLIDYEFRTEVAAHWGGQTVGLLKQWL